MIDEKNFEEKEKDKKKDGVSLNDFMLFFRNTSALGLAIGVVMADAVNRLVHSLVNGVITPFISIFLPEENFESLKVTIMRSEFNFGGVLSAIINFFIISVLIYITIKGLLRRDELLPATIKKSNAKVDEKYQ